MEEMATLSIGEPEFFHLKQPWLYSHAEMDSPGLESWHPHLGLGGGVSERLTSPLTVARGLRKRGSAQR